MNDDKTPETDDELDAWERKVTAFDAALDLFDATLVDDFNLREDLDKALEMIWDAATAELQSLLATAGADTLREAAVLWQEDAVSHIGYIGVHPIAKWLTDRADSMEGKAHDQ